MSQFEGIAESPCVRVCWLGDDLTGLGCFRSLDEIKEWGVADHRRRLVILNPATRSRTASQTFAGLP